MFFKAPITPTSIMQQYMQDQSAKINAGRTTAPSTPTSVIPASVTSQLRQAQQMVASAQQMTLSRTTPSIPAPPTQTGGGFNPMIPAIAVGGVLAVGITIKLLKRRRR